MSQLPFQLSIAGLDELSGFHGQDVSHVISLIDPDEPDPVAIEGIGAQSHLLLRLHDLINEREALRAPDREDVRHLIAHADTLAPHAIDHLLVHCHMGRSRSTAAAAAALDRLGVAPPDRIFQAIMAVRDPIWPNSRILAFADAILETGGTLSRAVKPIYHQMVAAHPEWTGLLKRTDRASDLDPHP